jgi:hypothetical protein
VCLSVGRRWSRLRRWGVDAGAHQQKQVNEKDGNENEAADEDVWFKSEHGFVTGKVRGRDVFVSVIAFVVVFVHADQLTSQNANACCMKAKYFVAAREVLGCDFVAKVNVALCGWWHDL